MKTTAEMMEVMQAYERGKPIEMSYNDGITWFVLTSPAWDWARCDYRVEVTKPCGAP